MSPRKRKRKPIKFRQVSFKLTVGQKAALDRFCRMHNTTPIRYIKALVNSQVERYKPGSPPPTFVTANQLELFDADNHQQGD